MDLIDPLKTAVVCVDLQNGIVAMSTAPHPASSVLENSTRIIDKLRAAGGLVVYVTVSNSPDGGDALKPVTDSMAAPANRPPDWAELSPSLPASDRDIRITKRQWGAFYGTELDLQLRRRGIDTLIVTGIATNVGVESTVRDAFERGYSQILVEDATASTSEEAHALAYKVTFPRLARIRSTDQVLSMLP